MTVFVGCPEGCRYNTASAVYDLVHCVLRLYDVRAIRRRLNYYHLSHPLPLLLVSGRTVTGPPREPNPEGQAYSEAAVSKRVSFIRCIFRFQVRDKIWWRPT